MNDKVTIRRLATGVPDSMRSWAAACRNLLHLIAGPPGTARRRWRTRSCSPLRHAGGRAAVLHRLGEPPLKMLRYQQQFSFFDFDKFNESIRLSI